MHKLKINIQQTLSHPTDYTNLEALQPRLTSLISERKYRNICADLARQSRNEILQILSPVERKWNCVELLNGNFDDGDFLANIHASVKSLVLVRVNCCEISLVNFEFPRLRRLKLFSCNGELVKNIESCSTLTELHISRIANESPLAIEGLTNLLCNNKNLETLTILAPNYQTCLPKQLTPRYQFKLKKLVIDSCTKFSSEEERECLNGLLKSQAAHLQVVDVNPWSGADVLEICFKMPNLKDFSCNLKHRDENLDWKNVNLSRNFTLERLHLSSVSPRESLSFYNAVFINAPNIKIYKAKFMHYDDLISLSANCKHFEELYIENFNVPLLPNYNCFPKLQRFKSWDVNDDLLKSLRTKGPKNVFEELILSC